MLIKHRRSPLKGRLILIGIITFIVAIDLPHGSKLAGHTTLASTVYKLSLTATLGGTVVDESDATVPDAGVWVKDVNGDLQRQATTNSDGSFVIPLLPPGSYTVAVQREGFLTAQVKGVVLKVNDRLALKIQLKVGDIGETVTVEAETSVVEKPTSAVTSVDGQSIDDLPLNGRSLQPIIRLTPGIVVTHTTNAEQGQFSVNGQRANANYFTVDGVSANIGVAASPSLGQFGAGSLPGLSVYGSTSNLFSLDAVQEVKIQTSAYAPEFGRMPGGQVAVTTQAGTDQLRGTLFEGFRHNALGAGDWFANQDSLPKSPFTHHNFGGVLGGPVLKKHAFFFLSYEGLRLRQPRATTVDVPSLPARAAAPMQIQPLLNAFPLPNNEETVNGLAGFSASYTDPSTLDATSLRIDHKASERLMLFGRYNYAPSAAIERGGGSGGSTSAGANSSSLNTLLRTSFTTQTLTVGANHLISSRISNDVRVNYSRTRGGRSFLLDDFGGAAPLDDEVIFPPFASRADSVYSFGLGGGLSLSVGKDVDNLQRQVNLVDNLSISAGNHRLKFGVDYRRLSPVYGQRKYNHTASFNGIVAALSSVASSVTVLTQDQVGAVFDDFSLYGQDTWNVTSRLSITYGLRWELNPAPSEADGQSLFTVGELADPTTITLAPRGTPLYPTTYGNFAPRVGAAYQLFQNRGRETIVRGGFGVFYDLGTGPVANSASYYPYVRRRTLANVPYPLDAVSAEPRPFSVDLPFGTIRAFAPDYKLPLTLQWNAALEQSLGAHQSVSASYVAAVGRRLFRSTVLFDPNPNFRQIFVATNEATSDYHALQLQYNRRLSQNLQTLAFYTWSHSFDIASNDSSYALPSSVVDPQTDRGPSDFDVRHSFAAALTYNIPLTTAKTALANRVLSNWSLNTIITARTATPVDVLTARDTGFGPFTSRPDLLPGVPLYTADATVPGGRVINRNAFALPAAVRQGTLGRNSLRGFSLSQVDLAVRRNIKLTEAFNLQFSVELFNLFNHPNFGNPVGDLGSNLFGRSTALLATSLGSGGINGGLNPLYQVGSSRSTQLTLKLRF